MLKKNKGFSLLEVLFVVAIIVILAGLLTPSLSIARRKVTQVKCQNNLKQIGYSVKTYAIDFTDAYPSDGVSGKSSLNLLVSLGYLDQSDVLYCPAGDGEATGTSDFFFAYQLDENDPAKSPIAVDDELNHPDPDLYNILYIDGHVNVSSSPPSSGSAPID